MKRFLVVDTHATGWGGGGKLITSDRPGFAALRALGHDGPLEITPLCGVEPGSVIPDAWWATDHRGNTLLVAVAP